ncbi:MAG: hypothetical protein WKF77_12090 [Planctomycetaceae bacterium]
MKFVSSLFAVITAVVALGLLRSTANEALAGYSPVPLTDDAAPVEDSMHEFMEYVFQPTYLRLKASMAAAPIDNKGWKAVKSDALILAESCNLLFVRKPDEHGDDWAKHATASKTHGAELYKAAKEKNFEAATTAYKMMLNNCNACHKQFEDGKHILQP